MQKRMTWVVVAMMLGVTALVAHQAWRQPAMAQDSPQAKVRQLPEGTVKGPIELADGESLNGAGVGKTIIDATGCDSGVVVKGGSGAVISDLTVQNASGTGVLVRGAQNVTIRRVRTTANAIGVSVADAKGGRIENVISDNNPFGIVVSGGSGIAVVNNTVAACSEVGISVSACPKAAVFNNCVVGSAVCLNVDDPETVAIDHNLYFGMYVGQMKGQTPKQALTAWQYITSEGGKGGLDAHSVQMPVEFKDAKGGDFTPTSVLTWALDRTVTAEWGAPELAGVKAPQTDILGQPRTGRVDLGAVETVIKAPRAADGELTVSSDDGLKSAGAFTKDGKLVAYFFHNMPLPKGKHAFWVPARDYLGQPIPAGKYDVRLAESDLRWTFVNVIADNGELPAGEATASMNPKMLAFAGKDTLVMLQGPSEDHTQVRGLDAATGKVKWHMSSCVEAQGLAVGKDGKVYVLVKYNTDSRLTRLDAATGKVEPFPNSKVGHVFLQIGKPYTMAALGDRLYVADREANKLHMISMAEGKMLGALAIAAPRCVASDEKAGLLWVISDQTLVALDAEGKKVAESKAVEDPAALAVCEGQLAVASTKTGKVHFLNASDPKSIKVVSELGKGDGPFGKFEADRFLFQRRGNWSREDDLTVSLALDASGRLGVAESGRRVALFDAKGKQQWFTFGVFGNWTHPSYSTGNRRMWDTEMDFSFMLDEKTGTWQVEALWDSSLVWNRIRQDGPVIPLGDLGKDTAYILLQHPHRNKGDQPQLTIARLDGFEWVPVQVFYSENKTTVVREDSNGDGKITTDDKATTVLDAQGNPMPYYLFARFTFLLPDGSISVMANPQPRLWKPSGFNDKGMPLYEGKNYTSPFEKTWALDSSVYDGKPGGMVDQWCGPVVMGQLDDGGYVMQVIMRGSGGTGLNNGAGTDLAGYAPDGTRRWVHPLAQYKGIAGMGTADDITVTTVFYNNEKIVVDGDGLRLGGFCEAPQLRYTGYWVDHPNLRVFKMLDNRVYVTVGNNYSGRHNWYRLDNQESLKKSRQPFEVSAERAKELVALDWQFAPPVGRPPQPQIRIKRLDKALSIDGDLEKWRKANVPVTIVVRPSSGMDGPGDCSGIIRMAYEGQNLYFQILQFDDVPTFHQRDHMFQQDAVELAINATFPNGFQFIAYKNPDGQDMIHRHRFMQGEIPAIKLRPEHAKRIVKVLDNAKDVTERDVLERLYGVDLSKSKVIVTEFVLPMDKETYAQAEADVVELGSGKSFWIGFFVDDNDEPYTDVQGVAAWPATFGMFSPKEEGAVATCE